jgi:hypothetical protein
MDAAARRQAGVEVARRPCFLRCCVAAVEGRHGIGVGTVDGGEGGDVDGSARRRAAGEGGVVDTVVGARSCRESG